MNETYRYVINILDIPAHHAYNKKVFFQDNLGVATTLEIAKARVEKRYAVKPEWREESQGIVNGEVEWSHAGHQYHFTVQIRMCDYWDSVDNE